MAAMNDDLLSAKFNEYERDVCNNLELIDVFKDNMEKSEEEIIHDIDAATDKAIDQIRSFRSELVKDAVAQLHQQLKDYKLYEEMLCATFSCVKESVKEALGKSQSVRDVAAIKLNKAVYALERPTETVTSFLKHFEELSKSDLGILVTNTVPYRKPSPAKKLSVKKKLEKHGQVRLPAAASARSSRRSSFSSSLALASDNGCGHTPRSQSLDESGIIPHSQSINEDGATTHSKSDVYPDKADGDGQVKDSLPSADSSPEKLDLLTSAVQAWNLMNSEQNSASELSPHSMNENASVGGDLSTQIESDLGESYIVPPATPVNQRRIGKLSSLKITGQWHSDSVRKGNAGGLYQSFSEQKEDESVDGWTESPLMFSGQGTTEQNGHDDSSNRSPSVEKLNSLKISGQWHSDSVRKGNAAGLYQSFSEQKEDDSTDGWTESPSMWSKQEIPEQNEKKGEKTTTPTVCIHFSGLAAASQSAGYSELSVVKEGKGTPILSKYCVNESNKGPLHARLSTVLSAPSLDLNFPIGACRYAGGLVICNSGDGRVLYVVYNTSGQVINITQLNASFSRPSAVVVERTTNMVYVKDDRCIRCFGSQLQLVKTFPPSTLTLYGLAVTSDKLLVTMTDCGNGRVLPKNPRLLKYSLDGRLVATTPLQLPLVPETKLRFMDIFQHNIYISDLGASHVYWANVNTGQLIKVIAGPGRKPASFKEPSGITCDSVGNMLIGDSRSNRIQVFDGQRRVYKGMLDCGVKGIVRPSSICLYEDNRLISVNYISHSINIYDLVI